MDSNMFLTNIKLPINGDVKIIYAIKLSIWCICTHINWIGPCVKLKITYFALYILNPFDHYFIALGWCIHHYLKEGVYGAIKFHYLYQFNSTKKLLNKHRNISESDIGWWKWFELIAIVVCWWWLKEGLMKSTRRSEVKESGITETEETPLRTKIDIICQQYQQH